MWIMIIFIVMNRIRVGQFVIVIVEIFINKFGNQFFLLFQI